MTSLRPFWRYYGAASQDGSYAVSPGNAYGQAPLDAPSVFNFYLPDYEPPGELGDAGLFAPELQIESESAIVATSNDLSNRAAAYVGNPANTAATIAVDLSGLFAIAGDPAALVAQVNHDLLYGAMPAPMAATLTTMVGAIPYSTSTPQARVFGLLQVVLASPAFAIQK